MRIENEVIKIQAIIDAWISGDTGKAITLTNAYVIALNSKYCLHCGKQLSPQARGGYCKNHRHFDPKRKAKVAESKNN